MVFSAIVIAVTIAVLLFFIITDKRIKIGKKSLGLYCLVPLIGAVVLAIGGRLPLKELADYFVSDTAVNPIKILSLFLSMTVFSIVLDEAGFFTYVANLAVGKSGSNQRRLFFYRLFNGCRADCFYFQRRGYTYRHAFRNSLLPPG